MPQTSRGYISFPIKIYCLEKDNILFFFSSGGKSPPKNHILLTEQTKEQV